MIGCVDLDEFSENFQFPIQKIMLQIFAVILRENNDEIFKKKGHSNPKKLLQILATPQKKRNNGFPKRGEGRGGQRPFRVIPKIHPNQHILSSLRGPPGTDF